jgi:hypothetical protein
MVERWNPMSLSIKNKNEMKEGTTDLKSSNQKIGLADRLVEIGRETAPLMNDDRTSKELMDELYDDETGLPK